MNEEQALAFLLDLKFGMQDRAKKMQQNNYLYRSGREIGQEQYGHRYDCVDGIIGRIIDAHGSKGISIPNSNY